MVEFKLVDCVAHWCSQQNVRELALLKIASYSLHGSENVILQASTRTTLLTQTLIFAIGVGV